MTAAFYIAAAVAVVSTGLVITRAEAVHALLYMVVSFLAISLVFYTLGAPFLAALEVIVYAGAIMVLFVFVVMMLNLGPSAREQEKRWMDAKTWLGPGVLSLVLLIELMWTLISGFDVSISRYPVTPKQVGLSLFGPYLLVVELSSMLLLAGLVGAYHLARREDAPEKEKPL